jgi:hypothetical protein
MQLKVADLGRPSMKSIVIVCHAPSGIGRGANRPGYATLSDFAY